MRVLVLCSGGDAPGMNKVLFTLSKKVDLFYVKAGFKGLVENDILKFDFDEKFKNEAGTVIATSRYPNFKEEKFFKKGLKNAKKFDFVVILGGNGSQIGAKRMVENGVKVFFVPSTIDNDVEGSCYAVGFDTAVTQCVKVVDNIMASYQSLYQTCLLEVMGNKSSAIAREVARRVQPDYAVFEEKDINYDKMAKIAKANAKKEKASLFVIKEKIVNICEIHNQLEARGVYSKSQIVGRLQRGGKPTTKELKMAEKFANTVIKLIKSNSSSKKILVDENDEIKICDF